MIENLIQTIDTFTTFNFNDRIKVYELVKSYNLPITEAQKLYSDAIKHFESISVSTNEIELDDSLMENSIFKEEILRKRAELLESLKKHETTINKGYNVRRYLPTKLLDTIVDCNQTLANIFSISKIEIHEYFFEQLDAQKILPCRLGSKALIRFINESVDDYNIILSPEIRYELSDWGYTLGVRP